MNDDNLTSLQDLTQENVLYTLKQRYSANKIYTYSGHTLVSINPYVYLPIYGKGAIQAYSNGFNTQNERFFYNNDNKNTQIEQENVTHSENHTKKAEASTQKDEAFFYPVSEAHIYSIAENALQSLCLFSSVTIIISGESGSGKTMNNNYVLEYFIKRTNDVEATNLNNNINFRINELLLAINPVLESFGNAKTILNENSSRFGKKLDLYLKNDKIVGAKILTYLLEKNRVTHTEKSEKNFHIFYYFCAYKNLNVVSDYCNFEDIKDEYKKKYAEILESFRILGIANVKYIENILLAILLLGGIKLNKIGEEYKIVKNDNYNNLVDILEIKSDDFDAFLLKNTIKTPKESFIVNNSFDTINNKKNTLARNLYAQLFAYLVDTFNNKLCTKSKDYKTVTVLDIYGFENLEQNTFDQFCINWANEKIQDDYVKRMFVNLQNMYKEEGIYLDDMKYDHKGSLQLFERPCGIVDLINEESCSNFGNESNLETKIKNYCKDVIVSNSIFQISHFATDVKYDLTGFITKNNEAGLNFNDVYKIPKDKNIREMVKNDFIAYLLSSEEKKPTIKKPTVLKTFKKSLDDLFESINDSKVLYVRCIKPNANKSNVFDDDYVHNQLKTSGIIETIEISKKTYSHYVFNEEYDERYGMLHGTYKIKRGKNRVFLSNETLYKLEQDRNALYNQFKQIILGIMKTQYEQKRLQSNKTILQQVLNKYIKEQREIKKKLNEQQQILKRNQEFEQRKETEYRDMIENENIREIDTNNNKLSYKRKQIINYSLHIENENNDLLNKDIEKRQDTYIASEIDTNSNKVQLNVENVDCIDKEVAKTNFDGKYSESEQFCTDNTKLTNENAEIDKNTNRQTKYVKNNLIDSEYRFDKKEITFVDSKIVYKKNKGDSDMDTGKHIVINVPGQENNEETVSELREKLKRYEKFCKAPCRNCKAMEIKYKYQTEELKRKNMLNLEIETYKKKIADLEKEIKMLNSKNKHDETYITESKNNENIIHTDDTKKDEANNEDKKVYKVFVKDNFIISFTSPYDVFGCLIELFIDFCPDFSSTFLPKNEALAFAQIVYQTMYKLNKNGESMKDLTDMFVHELKERFIIFERQINKVCFIVSNIIELKKVFVGERKIRLYITEISYNETLSTFDDVINILFKHICEMLKKKLQDLLPDTIILHQELKEFSCKERYFSSFFGKPPSISKLLEALEYSVSVLQHYHLPDQAWEECINYLLKTINARSFNGTIVKNDFLSFNRGMQINNNLNKIEKFCREIGFPEGVHNLEHIKDVVKLINYVKAGQKIDTILNGCTYLNYLQVTELLGKFKKDEKEYLAKEIKNYVCKDTTLEKFVNDSKINVFLNYEGVQHKFLVPRYVPSKYIQSILESL